MLRRIDGRTSVSGQVLPEDMERLKADGVKMIVNNRPDGEEPGQPSASEVEAAARAAGLDYRHIPISGGFSFDQVVEMGEALESARGQVLAFCKSGTRSIFLWALARAEAGDAPEELMQKAVHAGYDLTPIHRYLSSPRT
jgi:uncharacterized protein (TIGR01244 family)